MCRKAAPSIGVVFDRAQGGALVRIINPDFEWQLDIQRLAPTEYLIRLPRSSFQLSDRRDAMSLDEVLRICKTFAVPS